MSARLVSIIAVSSLCLIGWPSTAAVPEGNADLKAKVAQLVEQLGIASKANNAETELIKLGPDILPLLPGPDAKLSDDQKKHLKSVRTTLLEALVVRDLAPRTVTLQSRMPLSKALEQIEKQTGIAVIDRREGGGAEDPMLRLNLEKATFWQALDTVAREADLQVSLYDKDGKIGLREGPHRMLPVSYSGMFRVTAKRVSTVRDLDSEAHTCTVHLEIAWEPRFQPLFMQSKPESLEVKDDKGVALMVPEVGAGRAPPTGKLTSEVQVVMEAPRRNINKIGLMKGEFSIVGPTKMLTFTFDKLAKVDNKTPANRIPLQTQEGVTVKMRQFTTEPDLWTISFLLDYPPDDQDFESFESWLVHNEIHLVNKDGKRFGSGANEIDEQAGSKAIVTYRFVEDNGLVLDKPENYKLVYRTPGRIAKIPIHFEFKDLPLP